MYSRVIPRDLFNEAKLLKCLGQLSLFIHNGQGIRWPLRFEHDEPEEGFKIVQDPSSGAIYCKNLKLYCSGVGGEIGLSTSLNSREPYPLLFSAQGEAEEGEVFNNDGTLSKQFLAAMDRLVLRIGADK